MKKLIYSIAVLALLSSCGGESENFANAKIHKCNMIKYANEIKEGKDSQEELEKATRLFEISREHCIEEDGMTDFDEKIKEAECE